MTTAACPAEEALLPVAAGEPPHLLLQTRTVSDVDLFEFHLPRTEKRFSITAERTVILSIDDYSWHGTTFS